MQKQHALYWNLSIGGVVLTFLAVASLLILVSQTGILFMLEFEYSYVIGDFQPLSTSLVTTKEPLALTAYDQAVVASVRQAYPDDHSYLINTQDGGLQAITNSQSSVLNVDRSVYFTYQSPNTLSARRTSDASILWQHSFDSSLTWLTGPLQDGILFVSSQQEYSTGPTVLYAFSEQNGTLLWNHRFEGNINYVVSNESVYVEGMQSIEAFALRTGQMLWSTQVNEQATDFAVDHAHVYVLGKTLQALRVSDGHQVWSTALQRYGNFPLFTHILGAQGTNVYLVGYAGNDEEVQTIRAADGKPLWDLNVTAKYRQQLNQGTYTSRVNRFALMNGTLYWLINNRVYAFRGSDGMQIWYVQMGKPPTIQDSLVSQILGQTGDIIVVQSGEELVALQEGSGRMLWSFSSPFLEQMRAVISGQSILYGYAAHTTNIPPPTHFISLLTQSFPLYFCQNTLFIFALHSQNGTAQWNKHYQVVCDR